MPRSLQTDVENFLWLQVNRFIEDDLIPFVRDNVQDNQSKYNGDVKSAGLRAQQAVYVHFMLGKALFPMECAHELFTLTPFRDEAMIELIGEDAYHEFRERILEAYDYFHKNRKDPVLYEQAQVSHLRMGNIAEMLPAHTRRTWEFTMSQFPMQPGDVVRDQLMVNVMLKNMCIGAFKDNVHATCETHWTKRLPRFTECFATPFNTFFGAYHSMFSSAEKLLGSEGNFFRLGNTIPSGRYGMNPPFNNQILAKLANMLLESVKQNRKLSVYLITPAWEDAPWMNTLRQVLTHPMYVDNSMTWQQDLMQRKSLSDKHLFKMRARLWTFTFRPGVFTPNLLMCLGLKFQGMPPPRKPKVCKAERVPLDFKDDNPHWTSLEACGITAKDLQYRHKALNLRSFGGNFREFCDDWRQTSARFE